MKTLSAAFITPARKKVTAVFGRTGFLARLRGDFLPGRGNNQQNRPANE